MGLLSKLGWRLAFPIAAVVVVGVGGGLAYFTLRNSFWSVNEVSVVCDSFKKTLHCVT